MNETLPTWSELSAAGWVVLGNADLMLGVYPTVAGDVALTTQSAQDDVMRVFFVQLAELPLLIQKLEQARQQAETTKHSALRSASTQYAHDLITRVKGGG